MFALKIALPALDHWTTNALNVLKDSPSNLTNVFVALINSLILVIKPVNPVKWITLSTINQDKIYLSQYWVNITVFAMMDIS